MEDKRGKDYWLIIYLLNYTEKNIRCVNIWMWEVILSITCKTFFFVIFLGRLKFKSVSLLTDVTINYGRVTYIRFFLWQLTELSSGSVELDHVLEAQCISLFFAWWLFGNEIIKTSDIIGISNKMVGSLYYGNCWPERGMELRKNSSMWHDKINWVKWIQVYEYILTVSW